MSQLIINRLLKSSVCKNVIRHNQKVRMFSCKPSYPYLLIDHLLNATQCSNDQVYYGNKYHSKLMIKDKGLAEEVREAMTSTLSHKDGWRVNLETSEDNSTSLMLANNTQSDPVKHHLPPLPSGSRIHNVAISNSPDIKKEDLVVAVKFSGSHVSLCQPFSDSCSGWININTSGSVSPFSSLMYSKKNKKFLTVSLTGKYLWSLDLESNELEDVQPMFSFMYYDADLIYAYLEPHIWKSRTDHLVESPTGEHFLVKWFVQDVRNYEGDTTTIIQNTYDFVVFRLDTACGGWIHTEDIGDLCIFLGHSEALCVPASSSPGLRPNSIYYVGCNFGVYNIATDTTTSFFHAEDEVPLRSTEFPYWPPPFSY